jgi:hypothetical protein
MAPYMQYRANKTVKRNHTYKANDAVRCLLKNNTRSIILETNNVMVTVKQLKRTTGPIMRKVFSLKIP